MVEAVLAIIAIIILFLIKKKKAGIYMLLTFALLWGVSKFKINLLDAAIIERTLIQRMR